MTSESIEKAYRRVYRLAWVIIHLFYPSSVRGTENIPEGAALICPNHSNMIDPFVVAVAMGKSHRVVPLAKAESETMPVFGWVMRKLGTIFVRRGEQDLDAYRGCIRTLKSGQKLLAFPEGTRVHAGEEADAKTGVIRMAAKTRSPIVPVYLTQDKKLFRRVQVVFGEPYYIENAARADYDALARELMERIAALKES